MIIRKFEKIVYKTEEYSYLSIEVRWYIFYFNTINLQGCFHSSYRLWIEVYAIFVIKKQIPICDPIIICPKVWSIFSLYDQFIFRDETIDVIYENQKQIFKSNFDTRYM